MATNYHSDAIRCSFCHEEFFGENEIKEHLMVCGNKTDQCPKCGKYIRRAIFSYHYENDCANLDELDDVDRPPKPNRQVKEEKIDETECPFCLKQFKIPEIESHVNRCEKNPDAQREVRSIPVNYDNDRSYASAHTNRIPSSSTVSSNFLQTNYGGSSQTRLVSCTYCGKFYGRNILHIHMGYCDDNPLNRRTTYLSTPPTSYTIQCKYCKAKKLLDNIPIAHQSGCPTASVSFRSPGQATLFYERVPLYSTVLRVDRP